MTSNPLCELCKERRYDYRVVGMGSTLIKLCTHCNAQTNKASRRFDAGLSAKLLVLEKGKLMEQMKRLEERRTKA